MLYNIKYVMTSKLCLISMSYVMLYNMCHAMLYLTIIPLGHVGYEMIDSQRGA